MPDAVPALHHVVFCVHRDNQDRAASFWKDLGFTFVDIDLADVGLRVLLDWDRGIELISPTAAAGPEAADVQRIPDPAWGGRLLGRRANRGNRRSDLGRRTLRRPRGLPATPRRRREGYELDEARLNPLYGMPVTFLATDRL